MSDIFTFYGDKRNNIHLLLYFNVYDDKLDIMPGELDAIYEAKEHNIPIIFLVNKCPDSLFDKKKEKKILDKEIQRARKDTDFKDCKTFYINCITKRGFDELLQGIYEEFKKYIISDENLDNLKNGIMKQEDFNSLSQNSFFFRDIKPEDVFLNESLTNSVRDIKLLVVRLAGYYYNQLGFWKSIGFYLFTKMYNSYKKDSETNFFPILTDLLKKIYSNFGYEKKTLEECNNFIKQKISEYFNINVKLEKENLLKKKTLFFKEENKEKKEEMKEEKEEKEKNEKKEEKEKNEEKEEKEKNEEKEEKEKNEENEEKEKNDEKEEK